VLAKPAQHQLSQLQNSLTRKEQEIAAQNRTIGKLEKQLSLLQLQQNTPSPSQMASPQDIKQAQAMVGGLYRVFSLSPAVSTLTESLKQAHQAEKKARMAESVLLKKQEGLNQQISDLSKQLTTLQNSRANTATENETELNTRLATLNAANQQLKSELTTNKAKVAQTTEQVLQLNAAIRQLEKDKEQYANDNKLLTLQISGQSDVSEQLSSAKTQQQQLQNELASRQQQLTQLEHEKQQLQQQFAAAPTSAQLAESQLKIQALQSQLDVALLVQKKDRSAEEQIKSLQEKLDAALKHKAALEVTQDELKKQTTREAYAIGISLGEEILQLQAENRNWAATDSEQPGVLAGIIDTFQRQEKLSAEELQKTLMNISKKVKTGRDKYMGDLKKSTQKFIANFTKQKNTKKSDSGFWYQIDYAGDTTIPENATLDVIVKESLTNGTVIEDMDAKGIVLTQAISAFPPIFREALGKLKNHGSITIVVPPELAYGKKGYPPKVPPNATMVYNLRVSEVYPEPTKK